MDFEVFKPTKCKCNQKSIDFLTKPAGSLGNKRSPPQGETNCAGLHLFADTVGYVSPKVGRQGQKGETNQKRSIDFLTKPAESLGIHPISLVFSTHDPYNEWWAL